MTKKLTLALYKTVNEMVNKLAHNPHNFPDSIFMHVNFVMT